MLHPVVLSGGSGSRLWPLSRVFVPKQLLPLVSERSMLQETLSRLHGAEAAGIAQVAAPLIICNQEHRFIIAEQMRELNMAAGAIILEPAGRNTAPAIGVAALVALQRDADARLLVLAADHVITDLPGFQRAVALADQVARDGQFVTFGIVPTRAETGYGYIQRGSALNEGVHQVACFQEKPDAKTAQHYVESGEYLWNSGMFLFPAQAFWDELERLQPEIAAACKASVEGAYTDLDFVRLEETSFKKAPSLSVDHAVMEHTERAAVVPVDIGWSDVGTWASLWEVQPKDEHGNFTRGDVFLHDSHNNYISTDRQLVATVGINNIVVVATPDAVLVAHKDHAQDVKTLVDQLKAANRPETDTHRLCYRPWGTYEVMDEGGRFKVKRITVKPGATLSLQWHHHRSEHWVVVSGTAEVTLGEEARLLAENESIYIPLGTPHRLHNPGRIPLHLIEVQSGPYLGEDDIVRTHDAYGRVETGCAG